jgi:hypothetical protein
MWNVLRNVSGSLSADQKLTRYSTIGSIGSAVVNVMWGIAFSVSIISIAISAYLYIMSQGDPKRLETSWRAFIWSIVAGMVALGAFGVRTAIIHAIGVTAPEVVNNVPGF